MIAKPIRVVLYRVAMGRVAALLLTLFAFHLHFNLSSATPIYLFLVVVIALRWGFREASIVSLLCVACLDYFFTAPLFEFYISDSHDWVALLTFEAAAFTDAASSECPHKASAPIGRVPERSTRRETPTERSSLLVTV